MTYIGISAVWLKDHDAAIARKAREKLLNVIDHEIDQAPEDEHDEDYWRGIAEVHRIIESLRTTAPQSEQAGDHHE